MVCLEHEHGMGTIRKEVSREQRKLLLTIKFSFRPQIHTNVNNLTGTRVELRVSLPYIFLGEKLRVRDYVVGVGTGVGRIQDCKVWSASTSPKTETSQKLSVGRKRTCRRVGGVRNWVHVDEEGYLYEECGAPGTGGYRSNLLKVLA